MKRIFLNIIFSLLLVNSLIGQGWELSNYIEADHIFPKKTLLDDNSNTYILAEFKGSFQLNQNLYNSYGDVDLVLLKINMDGIIEWAQNMGSSKTDYPGGISLDSESNIYVTGSFFDTIHFSGTDSLISTGSLDIFLAKYNSDGGLMDYYTLASGSSVQYSNNIFIDANDNLICVGTFLGSMNVGTNELSVSGNGNYTNFISNHSLTGVTSWVKAYLGNNNATKIMGIQQAENGYYFGGIYKNNFSLSTESLTSLNNSTDIFLMKTDLSGNEVWIRKIVGNGNENFVDLETDRYNNLFVLGNYFSNPLLIDSTETLITSINVNNGGNDAFICKYNRSGRLDWAINKGSESTDGYNSLSIHDNILYATGYYSSEIIFNQDTLIKPTLGDYDAFLAAFNDIGDPLSAIEITGTNYNEIGLQVNMDPNLRAYVIGTYESETISIGDSTFSNLTPGARNLFYARYSHPFKAAFTNESYVSCQGYSDGMLTVTPYFGVPPYTYGWTKDGSPIAESDSVAEGLDAGLYRVSITDARDSVTTVQVQLNNPTPISIAYVTDEVNCYNGNDGGIDITASGGNNNYTYNWSGGTGLSPTLEDQTGLIAADYTVTVTDSKGCTASQTISLGQADPIIFGESVVVSTNADVDTGRVDLVLNGGTEPFTNFSWEGPDGFTSSEDSIESLNGGNYYLTVTDANSCLADTTFLVPNDSLFIGYMTAVNNVTCGDLTNGSAVVTSNRYDDVGPETHTNFEYLWFDMEDSTHIGGNFSYISNLDSSDYRVYIVDGIKGDSTFVNFKITKPQILNVNSIPSNPTCFGSSNGSINAITSGGTLPYSYEWSNSSTVEDLAGIQAGTYTLTVTDANNCTATTGETLENPEALAITFDVSNPVCPNTLTGSATANVTGGGLIYNYAWSDPGNQSTQTATGLAQGSYTVTVTDQNGCLESDMITLNDPQPISVTNVVSEDASCFGISDGWAKVTAGGGSGSYTYDWSYTGLGTDSVGDLGAGTYYVTVNDVNDCTPAIETIIIGEPTEIIVDIDTVDNICFGDGNGQIIVTPTGGSGSFDYTWGHASDNTGTLTNLLAGTYSLTLSDGACPEILYEIPVVEPAEIVISIDTTDISCFNAGDGELAINTTGGSENYTYTWSHDVTPESTIAITEPGSYSVTVSDGACPDKVYTIPVAEPDLFTVDIDTNVTNCFNVAGGSITVTPAGGSGNYSYAWSHTSDNVNQVSDLTYGSYDVTVSDGSCPDITANIFVDQPNPLVFDIDTTDVSCLGYSDGAISVNVTGGSETYTYTWGHTSSNVSELGGLSEGTYNLTISDGACPDSALAIPVAEPEELLVSINKEDLSCYNSGDGSVHLEISGGSESYDITWGHTTDKLSLITNLDAGNYNVTVDDGNCPVISESVELTEPEELQIAGYDTVNLSSAGAHDGQIIIHVTGGTKPYRYSINPLEPSQEDSVFNYLDAGKYKVVINDVNNCGPVATDSIELEALVGIPNYWEESSITYYPNPADDKVTIEISNLKTKTIDLKVINSMGSLIVNKEIEIPNLQNIIELRTEHLSQGIYFILINNVRLKTPLIIK